MSAGANPIRFGVVELFALKAYFWISVLILWVVASEQCVRAAFDAERSNGTAPEILGSRSWLRER